MSIAGAFTTGKSAAGSATIIAALVVIIAQLVELIWGYKFTPEDQEKVVHIANDVLTLITASVSIVGGAAAIWGRWRATQPITSVMPKSGP